MSERGHTSAEHLPPAEAIAGVLEVWLGAEVESARQSHNKILDEWSEGLKSFLLHPYEHTNRNTQKDNGHYKRAQLWTEQFTTEPDDEYMTARQLFSIQMRYAGMTRGQQIITANSQAEYEALRFDPTDADADIRPWVEERLLEHFSELPLADTLRQKPIVLEDLLTETTELNEFIHSSLRSLHERASIPNTGNVQVTQTEWLEAFQNIRRACLRLCVDYILYAAQTRTGSLRDVPMLQPKSYTLVPQIRYPFAGEQLLSET